MKTRTIELPDELYKELEKLVTGFNDTPTSIIKRLIKEHKKNSLEPRKQITEKEAEEIYSVAIEIYKDRLKFEDGVEYLVKEADMNENSAKIYIKFFIKLKEGALHRNKMTANSKVVCCFLNKILATDGKAGLKVALDSLRQHIQYRKAEKLTDRGYPEVYDEFFAKLTQ